MDAEPYEFEPTPFKKDLFVFDKATLMIAAFKTLIGATEKFETYVVDKMSVLFPGKAYDVKTHDVSGLQPLAFEVLKNLTGTLEWQDVFSIIRSQSGLQWDSYDAETKQKISFAAKLAIRTEMLILNAAKFQSAKEAAEIAYNESQKVAEAKHDSQQQKAKAAFENKKAVVNTPGSSMILNPEATKTQLYRALLRIHFQKLGNSGEMRYWSKGKIQVPEVSAEMHTKRVAWAKAQVENIGESDRLAFLLGIPFNPPPLELFMEDDAGPMVLPKSVVDDPQSMPDYSGIITGVGSSKVSDGAKILFYVKRRELEFQSGSTSMADPLNGAFDSMNHAERMESVKKTLTVEYTEFLTQLVDFGIDAQQLFGENNVLDYTAGSGRFNRTLRADPEMIKKFFWNYVQEYDDTEATKNMTNLYEQLKLKQSGPEMESYQNFEAQSLRRIHSLWRTFFVAPRLPIDVPAIRSVMDPQFLPHRLAGYLDNQVQYGMAFLDTAFVSTAITPPRSYLHGALNSFFNSSTMCCFMSLTIKKGTPAMPLFVKKNELSYYPTEEEIVLPPLCQYVYRGKREFTDLEGFGASASVAVYHYDVYSAFA